MASAWRRVSPMSSRPSSSRQRVYSSISNDHAPAPAARTWRSNRSTVISVAGSVSSGLPERVHHLLVGGRPGSRPFLSGVAAEDVAEAGGDDGLEAVVLQGPDGVLAGGAGAEVGARDQDRGALVGRVG